MSQEFGHRPVMVDEVVDLFGPVPPGTVVDATVGGGGHARALLGAHSHLRILGVDRDDEALAAAARAVGEFADRATLRRSRFDEATDLLDGPASGFLFDLGVSSWQLDSGERGFSYRIDAPLDMRMDRSDDRTAADIVNGYREGDLARIFEANGEARWARRIAAAIVARRPLSTTTELADTVKEAIPAAARRTGGHPAKRVFQAIRIEVNRELEILPAALDKAIDALTPGGRIVVLSYHSGEDRIVKSTFVSAATGGCVCPAELPCGCGARATLRLLNRGARKPSANEVAINPRAESARLRAAQRLADASDTTA